MTIRTCRYAASTGVQWERHKSKQQQAEVASIGRSTTTPSSTLGELTELVRGRISTSHGQTRTSLSCQCNVAATRHKSAGRSPSPQSACVWSVIYPIGRCSRRSERPATGQAASSLQQQLRLLRRH